MSAEDVKRLGSDYAQLVLEGGPVGKITLPDGTEIFLTAQQTVHAQVKQHGNAGRSLFEYMLVNIDLKL